MSHVTTAEFSELVRQYERLVYTICYQFVHDHQTAEDLAQETFLSAYLHAGECEPDSYKPWLARIAANKAKDYLKSAYHRKVAPDEDAGMTEISNAPQPEDITIASDEAQAIADEIRALKEPYHKVSVMFFLEEKSVEEISNALGRPPKTVHTQLYRAKQMLRGAIERRAQDGTVSGKRMPHR